MKFFNLKFRKGQTKFMHAKIDIKCDRQKLSDMNLEPRHTNFEFKPKCEI